MGMGFILRVGAETTATMTRGGTMQAHYLAESAANHAMWRLLNDPTFPANETKYYMHDLADGRYGYKVRRHTDTTFATIASIGALDETVVQQSYVLHILPPAVDTEDCVTGGLIGHYKLDDGSGLVAADSSGSGPDADLQNDGTGSGWTTGQVDGGYEFSDNNAYFRTPTNSTDLQVTDDYSISVWINADPSEKSWAGIVSKSNSTGSQNHWTLQFNNGSGTSKRLSLYHPSGAWVTTYTLADAMSAWHHITVTYQASPPLAELYVDGVFHSQTTSLTNAPGSGDGKLHIGAERTASSSYTFTGTIDDVRIYARLLSPEDIDTIFRNNCGGSAKLYWTDRGDDIVSRSDKDGSNIEDIVTSGVNDPYGIGVDKSGGKVYWADRSNNTINRSDLDGSNVESIVTGLSNPEALAVDIEANKVYWGDDGDDKISRANLDGTNPEDIVTGISAGPDFMTLDLVNDKIYWTETGGNGRIVWSDLDGSGEQALVTGVNVRGIAVDPDNNKLYWATGGSTKAIWWANLDGSNATTVITELTDPQAVAIDFDDAKIYWTDSGDDVLQRADLDGTNSETIVTGRNDPRGVIVDDLSTGGSPPPPPPLPSIIFEEFTETKEGSDTNTISVTTPPGTSDGDLLVAALAVDRNQMLSAPFGWTVIEVNGDPQVTFGVWYKIAGASEPGTHDFTWDSNEEAYGWMMRFTGHDAASPINVSSTDNGTSSTPNSPSVTTTVSNAMILRLGGFDDDDVTIDNPGLSGHSAITMDESGTGNASASGGAGHLEQASAGASGASSFTLSGPEQYRTVTIAIAPN